MCSSGALLAVLSRHYQPVTVLSFTKDGSHLLSGGEDGQVLHEVQMAQFSWVMPKSFLLPGVSMALGNLSCSSKPSWPSGWPARAKVFSESQLKQFKEIKMFTVCEGSPSPTTHWQSLHSTVGTDLHLSPGCLLPPLTRLVILME